MITFPDKVNGKAGFRPTEKGDSGMQMGPRQGQALVLGCMNMSQERSLDLALGNNHSILGEVVRHLRHVQYTT